MFLAAIFVIAVLGQIEQVHITNRCAEGQMAHMSLSEAGTYDSQPITGFFKYPRVVQLRDSRYDRCVDM